MWNTEPLNIPNTDYEIIKLCYTSKNENPKGKICGIWDNWEADDPLRKSGSWSQGKGAFRRLRYGLDSYWELVLSDGLESLKLHLQSTLAVNTLGVRKIPLWILLYEFSGSSE